MASFHELIKRAEKSNSEKAIKPAQLTHQQIFELMHYVRERTILECMYTPKERFVAEMPRDRVL